MPNNPQTITSTTQTFLDIYDITNDILIMKDGSTALIITVNAMNFGLLAEEEQDAIIYSYAGLLNSLNYSIQIVIRSQTKDVTSYLQLLKDEEDKATSEIKREWIKRYREFVGDLIKERNVLDKKFYVVVPASALEMGLLPPQTVLPGVKQPSLTTVERSVILEKAQEILEPKRDHIMAQFGRIGLYARQLTTQEIIQLFYVSYNPEAAEGQQITDTSSYTTPLVKASIQGGFMSDTPITSPVSAVPEPTGVITGPSVPPVDVPPATVPMTPPAVAPVPTPAPSTPIAPTATQPTTAAMAPVQPVNNPATIDGTMSATPSVAAAAVTTAPMTPPPAASFAETPSITPPQNPKGMAPPISAVLPTAAPTTPVEAEVQKAIESSLKELEQVGGVQAPVTTPPTVPAVNSTPTQTNNAEAMPQLPEI